MITHGHSDFYVHFIDPEPHTVCSYFSDFLVKKVDNTYVIIEVKGEHQLDNPIVKAKQAYAVQLAVASGITYKIIGGKRVRSEAGFKPVISGYELNQKSLPCPSQSQYLQFILYQEKGLYCP